MPTTESPSRTTKQPRSRLIAKLTKQQQLLRLNELDPSFPQSVVEQELADIWTKLPQDKTTKYHLDRLLMFQHFCGFMEGLAAMKTARDTLMRWRDAPAEKGKANSPDQKGNVNLPAPKRVKRPYAKLLLSRVRKSGSMETFLTKYGDKQIPTEINTWDWLKALRKRTLRPTWNDAAEKAYPLTRKAFQVQFRRLQEHVIEYDLAQDFYTQASYLVERRKSKLGLREKADKKKAGKSGSAFDLEKSVGKRRHGHAQAAVERFRSSHVD